MTLKQLRIKQKVSQVDLAKRLNSTQNDVSLIERGLRYISVPKLDRYINALNCTLEIRATEQDGTSHPIEL